MGKKNQETGLNERQERFCQLYVSQDFFANGTASYIQAYEINLSKQGAYNAARSSASDLLANPNILKRINDLLDLSGLNDKFVDKQLTFVITQNVDLSSKMSAIREYNKLKSRIVEKSEVKHTGDFDVTMKLE